MKDADGSFDDYFAGVPKDIFLSRPESIVPYMEDEGFSTSLIGMISQVIGAEREGFLSAVTCPEDEMDAHIRDICNTCPVDAEALSQVVCGIRSSLPHARTDLVKTVYYFNEECLLTSDDQVVFSTDVRELGLVSDQIVSFTIPYSVETIGCNCFEYSPMSEIRIPSSVRTFDANCFSDSAIERITIPDSVSTIEYGVFQHCYHLKEAFLPASLRKISPRLFSCCFSLENINIPDSVRSIGQSAFYGCEKLASIHIPSEIANIHPSAFRGCVRTRFSIGDDDESSNGRFRVVDNCLYWTRDEHEPCYMMFTGYGIVSSGRCTVPDSVKIIGPGAFVNCKDLLEVEIPDSVKKICRRAFEGCDNLRTAIIPADLDIRMVFPEGTRIIRR